jgi:hypothetical protein
MSSSHELHQIHLPSTFTDLYRDPTRPYAKPLLPFEEICQRYDWCEDMAQILSEPSLNQMATLHITELDVIERTYRGLLSSPEVMSPKECRWVMQRLCELLNWSIEDLPAQLDALQVAHEATNSPNSPNTPNLPSPTP